MVPFSEKSIVFIQSLWPPNVCRQAPCQVRLPQRSSRVQLKVYRAKDHNVCSMICLATSNVGHLSTCTMLLHFGLRVGTECSLIFLQSFRREVNTNSLIPAIPSLGLPLDQVCNKMDMSAWPNTTNKYEELLTIQNINQFDHYWRPNCQGSNLPEPPLIILKLVSHQTSQMPSLSPHHR